MAPIPETTAFGPSFRNLDILALGLDSRSTPSDLSQYLPSLPLTKRSAFDQSLPAVWAESLNSPTKRSANPSSDAHRHLQLSPRNANPASDHVEPGSGAVPPNAINMKGIQALFALIGAAFVIGGIWFFFWAKNGGFQWRQGDWDDYKSTVLRRKGPDGKTLSNATKSTRLGGGSVVAGGYSDEGGTIITDMSSEAPILEEKRNNKKKKKTGKGLRGGGGGKVHRAAAAVMEEKVKTGIHNKRAQMKEQQKKERWEGGFDDDMRAYRHEKPAKVGGLNRGSDAQFYGTNYSGTEPSSYGVDNSNNYNNNPPAAPRHTSRHDNNNNSGSSSPRRHQQRDSSSRYNNNNNNSSSNNRYHSPNKPPSTPPSSHSPHHHSHPRASYTDPLDFNASSSAASQGTKSYHHPIPGLSGAGAGAGNGNSGYRTGRSPVKNGGGGRRRRDSLDDSD